MARIHFIILFFLLSACAQVGTLTGGDKDVTAPQPINEKMSPPNESVHFTSKSVEIPFKEFIRLNEPGKNIRMVPPHATIIAKVKGKDLYLNWEDTLRENTTYTIYLNNAVKDITEGNDTIIQYVFSTGDFIDSLSYTTKILDAWTNQPVSKCVVGLFDSSTEEILYFSETNAQGEATIKYIAPNNFTLIAFMDENGDLIHQDHEKVAFPENNEFQLNSSFEDTIPIRLFQPILKPTIRSSKPIAKGVFNVTANRPINTANFYIDSVLVEPDHLKILAEDSVLIFQNTGELKAIELIIDGEYIQDTVRIRFPDHHKKSPIIIKSSHSNNEFAPSDTLSFESNDFIEEIDTSLIEVINMKDSIPISGCKFQFYQNEIQLFLPEMNSNKILVVFKKNAVKTSHGFNKDQPIELYLKQPSDFGTLALTLPEYSENVFLQMLKNGKVVREFFAIDLSTPLQINEVPAGKYTFRIIEDVNNNKKWDVGDYESRLQAEKVIYYSKAVRVRANWEINVVLE